MTCTWVYFEGNISTWIGAPSAPDAHSVVTYVYTPVAHGAKAEKNHVDDQLNLLSRD